jgi:general secretion pathway protein L
MADSFVLNIPAAPNAPVSWVVVDDHGAPIQEPGSGTLGDAAAAVDGQRVVVLCPATHILRVSVAVPLKGNAKIRQALPFALEEQIAGDVEEQHFAFAKAGADGKLPVAVVEATLLDSWLRQLDDVGLQPDAMFAESDGVAFLPSTMTVLLHNDSVIVRAPDGATTVADIFAMQAVLELIVDQHLGAADEDAITLPLNMQIYCDADNHARYQEFWERLRMRAEDVEIKLLAAGALPRLAGEIISAGGVDLLQGRYARKTEISIDWDRWRLVASLCGGAVLIALLAQGAEYWSLSRQENQLDNAATQLLTETFPQVGEVADPWAELRTQLGADIDAAPVNGPGFGEALDAFATANAANSEVQMETMSYRSGVVSMQLTAPSVETLDKLRQSFVTAARGQFSAEILSANPTDDAIQGRMQIKASGS